MEKRIYKGWIYNFGGVVLFMLGITTGESSPLIGGMMLFIFALAEFYDGKTKPQKERGR